MRWEKDSGRLAETGGSYNWHKNNPTFMKELFDEVEETPEEELEQPLEDPVEIDMLNEFNAEAHKAMQRFCSRNNQCRRSPCMQAAKDR